MCYIQDKIPIQQKKKEKEKEESLVEFWVSTCSPHFMWQTRLQQVHGVMPVATAGNISRADGILVFLNIHEHALGSMPNIIHIN